MDTSHGLIIVILHFTMNICASFLASYLSVMSFKWLLITAMTFLNIRMTSHTHARSFLYVVGCDSWHLS